MNTVSNTCGSGWVDNKDLLFFTVSEFRVVAFLSELIIPADERSPGALAAKVPDYLDLIVSEMAPDKQQLWSDGLAELEQTSQTRFGCDFSTCSTIQKSELMDWLSESENNASTLRDKFFLELKSSVVTGFYTSEIGLHLDLRYEGNVFVDRFTGGCTDAEHHES